MQELNCPCKGLWLLPAQNFLRRARQACIKPQKHLCLHKGVYSLTSSSNQQQLLLLPHQIPSFLRPLRGHLELIAPSPCWLWVHGHRAPLHSKKMAKCSSFPELPLESSMSGTSGRNPMQSLAPAFGISQGQHLSGSRKAPVLSSVKEQVKFHLRAVTYYLLHPAEYASWYANGYKRTCHSMCAYLKDRATTIRNTEQI